MNLIIVAVAVVCLALPLGHAHADGRHGRAHGRRGTGLVWYTGRGSAFRCRGFRAGHKL